METIEEELFEFYHRPFINLQQIDNTTWTTNHFNLSEREKRSSCCIGNLLIFNKWSMIEVIDFCIPGFHKFHVPSSKLRPCFDRWSTTTFLSLYTCWHVMESKFAISLQTSSNKVIREMFLHLWTLFTQLRITRESPKNCILLLSFSRAKKRRSFRAISSTKLFVPAPRPIWIWKWWFLLRKKIAPPPHLLSWDAPSKNAHGIDFSINSSVMILGAGRYSHEYSYTNYLFLLYYFF